MAARIQTLEWLNQRIDELERRNLMLSIIARRPLSGWQKAEAAAEIRRAERLFNENCTLRLRITELEERCESYKEIGLRLEADIRQQNIAECAKWLDDEQDRFPNEYPLVTGDDMLEHFKT